MEQQDYQQQKEEELEVLNLQVNQFEVRLPQASNRRYSQSAYNQYRQQSVNQVQSNVGRENVTQGERVNFTILLKDLNTRLKKVEENLNSPVIPEENDLYSEKYDLLSVEVSNLKKLIMDLQSVYVVQNKKIDELCVCAKKKIRRRY